jgi:hypothetical protein
VLGVTARTVGIATASATLFRSLGGSIGTAAFGAVFAAHSVQTVFLVAAPRGDRPACTSSWWSKRCRSAAPQP